ncbi:MAG: SAM-dependent methyltransferase, partial [Dermatophilaceae bacterium]
MASSAASPSGKPVHQPGRVAFVGAGPGDPGLLTLRAAEYLATADVVVIDQVSREDFVARYARPDVEIIDAGHGEQGQPLTHASRAKLLVKAAKAAGAANGNGLVVRLMDGDPAMFNGLSEEALACRKAGI